MEKKFPIIVADSDIHGHGVFATRKIAKGEIIELCPYIVLDDDDVAEANRLQDYLFTSPDEEGDYLCVLGYGMIYNHSDMPNAEWEMDPTKLQGNCASVPQNNNKKHSDDFPEFLRINLLCIFRI